MIHNKKKVAKIIEELTMYFFSVGAKQIQSGIEVQGNQVTILFEANYKEDYRHNLNRLEEYLNETKNEGIEDFYWELAGSGDPGESSQLLLVGMMIDSAEVSITEDKVVLKLRKEFEEGFR